MKSLALNMLVAAAALTSSSAFAGEGDPPFEKLFNRAPGLVTEADGWVVRRHGEVSLPPKWNVAWEIDSDGILHGPGHLYHEGKAGTWPGTWLLSQKEYSDFIFETDFKFANGGAMGNGGIALRAPLYGNPAYDGLELQITDERFERGFFPNATNAQLTGALYMVSPAKELAYIPGEWNHIRIEMRGSKAKVWLNQKLVQDVDLKTLTQPGKKHGKGQEILDALSGAQRPLKGHIGFQEVSEEGENIMFRNVQVAELK